MAFQPSVHTVTWLECLGSCHVAQFMSLHAKNGCWVKKRTNLRSRSIKTRETPLFADKRPYLCFQRRNLFTKKNVYMSFDERNTVSWLVGPQGCLEGNQSGLLSTVKFFPVKSNLRFDNEKKIQKLRFTHKQNEHTILHIENPPIISFMPVDNVTACQSWSYCTLSNDHFYFWAKNPSPDIFRTHTYIHTYMCVHVVVYITHTCTCQCETTAYNFIIG